MFFDEESSVIVANELSIFSIANDKFTFFRNYAGCVNSFGEKGFF